MSSPPPRPPKRRIDQLLVERGLAESRERAQALILAGYVSAGGHRIEKAGQTVLSDAEIAVAGRLRYVSRGGLKLEAALSAFHIDVTGQPCLDIGASTGGFTDCLLQHGAARVYAFDTGAGQLAWKLRTDPRVILRENCNARFLQPSHLPEPVYLAVCDVSFISVTLILPVLPPLLLSSGALVILIKPQFEVGRAQVGKGGIVRDPALHAEVCANVSAAVEALGFHTALMESPILGAEGNREFLLYANH